MKKLINLILLFAFLFGADIMSAQKNKFNSELTQVTEKLQNKENKFNNELTSLTEELQKKEKKYIISLRGAVDLTLGTGIGEYSAMGSNFNFGLNADFKVGKKSYIGTGLTFQTKTLEYLSDYDDIGFKFSGKYLSIPLDWSYRGAVGYFRAGFHFDVLLSSATKFWEEDIDVDDMYSSLRMGMHAGLGFTFGHFDIGFLFQLTFTNMVNKDYVTKSVIDYSPIGFAVGYNF